MRDAGIEYRYSEYLGTDVQVGTAGGRVVSVGFGEPADEAVEVEEGEGTDGIEAVFAYLGGEVETSLDVPYALTVTGMERRALERTRDVPYGSTLTYDEFASSVGEDDVAAVREAVDSNPVPIVLPSHRVVSEEGVGGFAGPRRVKELLLELEGADVDG